MCRAIVACLLSFSLLLLNPALPPVYGQSQPPPPSPSPDDSGYWSMPPDRDMAQAYPPGPSYGNAPGAPYDPNVQYGSDGGQGTTNEVPEYDPADRDHGVARLSIADGEVNVRRGDTGEPVAGAINAPLLTQDHVQTSPNGRAEVELDSGDAVRLAPSTELGLADVRYHRAHLQLGLGTVLYRVLRAGSNDVEMDTPSVGVRATSTGEFRISVYDDGTTQVTVRTGAAEILSANGREPLNAGQSLLVRGDSSHVEYQWVSAPAFDQLEGWSRERDRQLLSSQSYRYVNPDVYGADDLDRYGSWVGSQYGQVWQPQTQSADWAPYSNGDWTYEPYYGWTWVDTAPWGWAPYHYGRWFYNGPRGWCWWPGSVGVSAFWSPALVGFFGLGAGLAWVALAPFEHFHPWWGSGYRGGFGGYGYRGGGWGGYRNAGFRGGAIFAARGQFGLHNVRYGFADRNQLAHANFLGGRIPVTPSRANYAFSNRTPFGGQRFASATQHGFFGSSQGSRGNFAGSAGWGRSGNSSAAPRGTFGGDAARTQSAWHNFGDPGRNAGTRQSFAVEAPSPGGWHNFGQAGHGSPASTPSFTQRPAQNWQQPHGQAPSSRSFAPSYSPSPRPMNGAFNGGYHASGGGFGSYQAPHYSAPSHYSGGNSSYGGNSHASQPRGGGGNHGGGSSGGSASHASGGGHSSGGGGHHR